MDDGFNLGLFASAGTAEAHPNRKRVGKLVNGSVKGVFGTLCVIIVIRTCRRCATSIHATVGDVAVGQNTPSGMRVKANTLVAAGIRTCLRRLFDLTRQHKRPSACCCTSRMPMRGLADAIGPLLEAPVVKLWSILG